MDHAVLCLCTGENAEYMGFFSFSFQLAIIDLFRQCSRLYCYSLNSNDVVISEKGRRKEMEE